MAPVVTAVLVFHTERKSIRREVKWKMIAGLDDSELVLLRFHKDAIKTDLHWKHSHEFDYQGQMYDIVKTQESADSVFYYCWWDYEETQLNRKLSSLVTMAWGSNPGHNQARLRLLSFYVSLYFNPLLSQFAFLPSESLIRYEDKLVFQSPLIHPLNPPPETFSSLLFCS
ncbi:MAG: hypothetical protein JXR27_05315 [Paludibacteraceae bacterium]|nr:hypothetical protein [Paludibacteraceae bacterium]